MKTMKMTVKQLKHLVTEAVSKALSKSAAAKAARIVQQSFGDGEERSIRYQVHGNAIELDHYDLGGHWWDGESLKGMGTTSKHVAAWLDSQGARRKKRKKLVRDYPIYD